MKELKRSFIPLCFLLSLVLLNIFYSVLNNPDRGVYSLMTDMDRGIPFLKIFIIPYIAWYFYIFITLAYLCIKDRDTYYKTLTAYCLGLVICYVIYFVYQTAVLRPILTGDDILTKAVSFIYSLDQPYNCFPSIHSLSSYLMIKAINTSSAKNTVNTVVVNCMSWLIIMSTLFVKQHVVLDALSAILLGELLYKLVYNFNWERTLAWIRKLYSSLTMRKKLEI